MIRVALSDAASASLNDQVKQIMSRPSVKDLWGVIIPDTCTVKTFDNADSCILGHP
jgi:hypothetical protein